MNKKYKIGYTTGVFDMFHIGHLNILKLAKEQCEYLIVGVSTDEVVRQYKNKVPVIKFEERIAIVDAIQYVDMAVPQNNMNKLEALEKYHFNVLFHGDDWKDTKMYNEYEWELQKHGVELIFLPHTEGISSSLLKENIESRS